MKGKTERSAPEEEAGTEGASSWGAPSWHRRVLAGAVALAVVAGIGSWIIYLVNGSESPEEVTKRYVTALKEGRYQDAMDLVEDDQGVDPSRIVSLEPGDPRSAVEQASITRDEATVQVGGDYASLERTFAGWRLKRPAFLTSYDLRHPETNEQLMGLPQLGTLSFSTAKGQAVPEQGWSFSTSETALPLVAHLTGRDGFRNQDVPVKGWLSGEGGGLRLAEGASVDAAAVAPGIAALVKRDLTFQTYYDGLTAGPQFQRFGITSVTGCVPSLQAGGAVAGEPTPFAIKCSITVAHRDQRGRGQLGNFGDEVRVMRQGQACTLRAPRPVSMQDRAPEEVYVLIRDGRITVAWAHAAYRGWDGPVVLGEEHELTDPCGAFAGQVDFESIRPVAGLVPKNTRATTLTEVSAPLDQLPRAA